MWTTMVLIALLFCLSVYGAFLGPKRAKEFFNSIPLAVFWLLYIIILIAGIGLFRRLLRVPALLLIHAGCIFILAGALWSSTGGHELRQKLLGIDKIRTGQMVIYEGDLENLVALENNQQAKLPFSVKLKDFRIEYYKPEYLWVQSREGQSWKIPVETGGEFSLGADFGTVKILKVFENFKITIDGDKRRAIDDSGPGSNPAIEVEIKSPDGIVDTRYVFERFPGHSYPEDRLLLSYHRIISDYISELEIIKDGKVLAKKDIEVNHPLHFGGYHFYQSSYDAEAGQYTVLEVVSDSGLSLVYGGYLMLCIGVLWHLWLRHIFTGIKLKSE